MPDDWKRDLVELDPYFVGGVAEFAIGPGWSKIVLDLHHEMVKVEPEYKILQVKEKFGGLRYYTEPSTEAMRVLTLHAERKAWCTCYECGASGEVRPLGGGSFITLCDVCEAIR